MLRTKQHNTSGSHLISTTVTLFCVLAASLLIINRQYVVDQLSVWQYHPSSAIATLAANSGMNSEGMFYFYASQPALDDAQDFNKECTSKESGTAILGCYDGRNIYIYDVTDSRLAGIREVTAAHEMLHAVYARMSDSEKKTVDALLEAEYAKIKDNKDFAERMAFYARTEPGERDNELHSVIGTEVADLSPALEAHYRQYFSDRSKVVAYSIAYTATFTNLQTQSDQLSSQLTQLGNTIESDSLSYNNDVNQLNADIQTFNTNANDGNFTSQSDFQNERDALMARATQLDTRRTTINNEVTQYETLRSQLAAVASQSNALNKSINSSLAPAPSL
jgi:hypothetical protein